MSMMYFFNGVLQFLPPETLHHLLEGQCKENFYEIISNIERNFVRALGFLLHECFQGSNVSTRIISQLLLFRRFKMSLAYFALRFGSLYNVGSKTAFFA